MYAYARPGVSAVLDTVAMDLAASDDFSNSVKSNGDRDMVAVDAFPLPHSRSKEFPAARMHSAALQHHPAHAFPIRPSTSGEVRMKGRQESCDVHAPVASGALANSFEVSVKTFRIPGFEISNEGIKQVPVANQKKSPAHTPPTALPTVSPPPTGPSNWASGSYSGQMLAYNDAILEHKNATETSSPPSSFTSLIRSPTELIRLSNVGRGACGTVVRALHVPSLKLVAIKQIGVFDKDRRHQLVKELRGLSATADINELISLYGAFFDEGTVSLVLEYMNRHSLQEQLNQHGPMSEFLLQRVCLHAVRGLAQLHARHLIHRDIKPGNMLINSKVEIKLADFGVLAALEHSQDFAKSYVGTVMYMSPERVDGVYGTAADIWSLGQTLITLATGHTPYDTGAGYFGIVRKITQEPPPSLPCSANPQHVASGVRTFSPELCDFVAACLIPDATKRWTAKQLLEHPFLKTADAVWANSHAERQHTISVISRLGHNDVADVQTLLQIVAEKCYFETGDQYRRSLFDLARVAKLAEEFGIDPKDMQELFESSYRQSFARWQAKVQQQQMQPQHPFAQIPSADIQSAPSYGAGPALSATSQLLPAEHPAPPVLPIENQGPVQLKMPLHRRNKAQ